eukprot:COSAG01_NODE_3678_length_5803_cov_60.798738_6_plen_103_part_00
MPDLLSGADLGCLSVQDDDAPQRVCRIMRWKREGVTMLHWCLVAVCADMYSRGYERCSLGGAVRALLTAARLGAEPPLCQHIVWCRAASCGWLPSLYPWIDT